jgi:hypothetical protein
MELRAGLLRALNRATRKAARQAATASDAAFLYVWDVKE